MKDYIAGLISDLIDDYRQCSLRKQRVIHILAVITACVLLIGVTRSCTRPSTPESIQQKLGLVDLSLKDDRGDKWELDLVRGQPVSQLNTRMDFGPPLLVTTDAQLKDGEISIGIVVTGQAGEEYVGGVRKNGKWQEPPSFTIVSDTGKMLASGTFKYG